MLTSLEGINRLQEIFDADFTELLKQKQLSYQTNSSQFVSIGNFIAAYNKYLDDIFYGRITDKDMAVSSYNRFVRDFNDFIASNEQEIEEPELEESLSVYEGTEPESTEPVFKKKIVLQNKAPFPSWSIPDDNIDSANDLTNIQLTDEEESQNQLLPKLPDGLIDDQIGEICWKLVDKFIHEGTVVDQKDVDSFVKALKDTGVIQHHSEPSKHSATIHEYIAKNQDDGIVSEGEGNVLSWDQKNTLCREMIKVSNFLQQYLSSITEAQLEETVACFINNATSDKVDDFANMTTAFNVCAEHISLTLSPNGMPLGHLVIRAVNELAFHMVFQFSAASKVVHKDSDEGSSSLGGEDTDDS